MNKQIKISYTATRVTAALLCTLLCLTLNGQKQVDFFLMNAPKEVKGDLGIRGSVYPLSWDKSIPLLHVKDSHKLNLTFKESVKELEFKFVIEKGNEIEWESCSNRLLNISNGNSFTIQESWNKEQVVDLSTIPLLEVDQLMKDYTLIEKVVLEIHPATYRYNSKEEIAKLLVELKTTCSQPLSHREAFLAFAKVASGLKCGHTRVGAYNQSPIINAIIHEQKDKLPFAFKWIEDEMIITHNASDHLALKRGDKIVSINDIPVSEIKKELMQYAFVDGGNDKTRTLEMEIRGSEYTYDLFDVFYPLMYIKKDSVVKVEVQLFEEVGTDIFYLNYLSLEERNKIIKNRYPEFPQTPDDFWELIYLEDSIARLQLNSFSLYGKGHLNLDYKKYFKHTFKEIKTKKIKHLILDIRGNSGGNDEIAIELFRYLKRPKEYVGFDRSSKSRYLELPNNIRENVRSWGENPWYFDLSNRAYKVEGEYNVFVDSDVAPPSQKKNVFNNNMYLLTSPRNVSLAYYTAAEFQNNQLGIIVGEETGGNQNDINGGQILFMKLPESTINFEFPVVGLFSNQIMPNSGVIPEVIITYTRKEIANDFDPVMHKVLEIILENADR